MSMTPAFSPGPWITHGALVGSPRRCTLEDLYEQCSFHMAEKIPSSVMVGSRPMSCRMRSYSSGLRPWAATSSGVMRGSLGIIGCGLDAALPPLFRRQRCSAKRAARHDSRICSAAQRLFGHGTPLGLRLAHVVRRAPELRQHVGQRRGRLGGAADALEQQPITHARLGAGIIAGYGVVLVERFVEAAGFLQGAGIEQVPFR